MGVIDKSLHFTLSTPECKTCGPTDYEKVFTDNGARLIWACTECGHEMNYLFPIRLTNLVANVNDRNGV